MSNIDEQRLRSHIKPMSPTSVTQLRVVTIGLRVTQDTYDALARIADTEDRTVSAVARRFVEQGLESHRRAAKRSRG